MLTFKDHRGQVHIFTDLPDTSQQAIVNRAVAHIFGNEVASTVVGKIRGVIAGKDGKAADVTNDQVKAFRGNAENDATIEAWMAEARDAKVKALIDGTLGVRVAGAKVDPLEAMIEKVAIERAKDLLGKQAPSGSGEKATTFTLRTAEGAVEFVGRDGLVEFANYMMDQPDTRGRFTRHKGEAYRVSIEAEAKRRLAAKQSARADAPTDDNADAEALF